MELELEEGRVGRERKKEGVSPPPSAELSSHSHAELKPNRAHSPVPLHEPHSLCPLCATESTSAPRPGQSSSSTHLDIALLPPQSLAKPPQPICDLPSKLINRLYVEDGRFEAGLLARSLLLCWSWRSSWSWRRRRRTGRRRGAGGRRRRRPPSGRGHRRRRRARRRALALLGRVVWRGRSKVVLLYLCRLFSSITCWYSKVIVGQVWCREGVQEGGDGRRERGGGKWQRRPRRRRE